MTRYQEVGGALRRALALLVDLRDDHSRRLASAAALVDSAAEPTPAAREMLDRDRLVRKALAESERLTREALEWLP